MHYQYHYLHASLSHVKQNVWCWKVVYEHIMENGALIITAQENWYTGAVNRKTDFQSTPHIEYKGELFIFKHGYMIKLYRIIYKTI